MSDGVLTKTEYDAATNALEGILSQAVEQIDLSDTIPLLDEVKDSNKVFKGKLSVLFVDMRKSTDLTDMIKSKKMVKVYRAFIRAAIQAIRYSGGHTRQFAGDGVMGVFQDTNENDISIKSSQKAINAARYILTLVDYCLNPALKKHMSEVSIGCGVGVCTGEIMITKVGMRGKEADDSSENETGIVWVGSTTNYANRFCSLAAPREIFIDEKTYSEIDTAETWSKTTRIKGNKAFSGYAISEYYLTLAEGIAQEPERSIDIINPDESFVQNIFDETQERALQLIDEISKKSAELALALDALKKRETQVTIREGELDQEDVRLQQLLQQLDSQQKSVNQKDFSNKIDEYKLYMGLFSKVFCKDGLIKLLGKDYWLELINKMISLGKNVGMNDLNVKKDLDCYLVDIYMNFDMYEEAYDALCVQAEYSSWLNTSVVENVVRKSGHWARLKEILEKRVNLSATTDYQSALRQLQIMGY